ncbi:hypothetical protein LTS18_011949, partial [Coniosporium uncinatum]
MGESAPSSVPPWDEKSEERGISDPKVDTDREMGRSHGVGADRDRDEEELELDGERKKNAGNDPETGLERTKSAVSIAQTLSPLHEFFFVAVVCMAQFM